MLVGSLDGSPRYDMTMRWRRLSSIGLLKRGPSPKLDWAILQMIFYLLLKDDLDLGAETKWL